MRWHVDQYVPSPQSVLIQTDAVSFKRWDVVNALGVQSWFVLFGNFRLFQLIVGTSVIRVGVPSQMVVGRVSVGVKM